MRVEFIWDRDCPNVEEARANLMRAFSKVDLTSQWQEWKKSSPEAPEYVTQYGSPTILVDGEELTGQNCDSAGDACRIYSGKDGKLSGVPSVETIASALRGVPDTSNDPSQQNGKSGGLSAIGVIPGLLVGILPKLSCPLCWPAYAAALSALGLGFLMNTAWLLPISTGLKAVAVGSLAWGGWRRGHYGPFWLGLAAGIALLVGKFEFDSQFAVYSAAAGLAAAAIWNLQPFETNDTESQTCCS